MTAPTLWQESLDAAGRTAYVAGLLPMAYKLAGKYAKRSGHPFDELLSAAFLGLANAADKFNPSLGYAESTYGHYAIERAIWAELNRKKADRFEQFPELNHKLYYNDDAAEIVADHRDNDRSPERNEQRRIVAGMLRCLEPRARKMLRLRIMRGQTLEQVAERFGITHERVRQIVGWAMRELKVRYAV